MGLIPAASEATHMTYHGLEMPQERIAGFCRRYHIRRLALSAAEVQSDPPMAARSYAASPLR